MNAPMDWHLSRALLEWQVELGVTEALDAQPVTEVCLAVGYQSLGAFSSLFKRHFGVAPTEWRRRVRTQVPVMGDVRRVVHPGCLELMAWLPAAAFRNFEEA